MTALTILTACTSRKVHPAPEMLRLRSIARGPLDEVGRAWTAAINAAAPVSDADRLYAGRDYRRLAEAARPTRPYIVSAGLGLLAPDTIVPSYDATVAGGVEDSVFARVTGQASPRAWFDLLQRRSRYAVSPRTLPAEGLILAALPARYLAMVADDLIRLGPERIRLFTGSDRNLPDALAACRMPYDGLLADVPGYNGPLVGFAERALCHFLTSVCRDAPDDDRDEHRRAVRSALNRAHESRRDAR